MEAKGKLICSFSHLTCSEDDVGLNSNSEDLSLSNDLVQETKRRLRSLEAEADVSTFTHFSQLGKNYCSQATHNRFTDANEWNGK